MREGKRKRKRERREGTKYKEQRTGQGECGREGERWRGVKKRKIKNNGQEREMNGEKKERKLKGQ